MCDTCIMNCVEWDGYRRVTRSALIRLKGSATRLSCMEAEESRTEIGTLLFGSVQMQFVALPASH